MLFLRLLKESVFFAYQSIMANKLRTFLSLFGITIGIFAIIAVFTVIDSLEISIRTSISSLGDNVVYIQKWPWEFGPDYKWWVYLKRPVPTLKEYEYIKKMSQKAEITGFSIATQKNLKYQNNSIENSLIVGVTENYQELRNFDIATGRFFSSFEMQNGHNVCVIGDEIASTLFENKNPVGKQIDILGRKVNIIGIAKKEGKNVLGANSSDNVVVIPINYARNLVDMRNDMLNPQIMVKTKHAVSIDELKEELRGILRAYRRLKPLQDDNFALNQASYLTNAFSSIFAVINLAGWVIGGFSILVGGFGIANIMFVSVKERTKIIGIQKSLGAKNYFILFQFLFEAVLLSLLGGILGLLFIYIGSKLGSKAAGMDIFLTLKNIIMGLSISAGIGIISGFAPAWSAARLNPVDAINSHF